MEEHLDVTVVLRTCGERTTALCREILLRELPAEQVIEVSEAPFWRTLLSGLEVGLKAGRTWTICLDADVLMVANGVHKAVRLARATSSRAFGWTGRLLDQFYGCPKYRGLHVYRTSQLEVALELGTARQQELASATRPETALKHMMDERGHSWIQARDVLGIHDYGQHYCDIFRKMLTRAHKSTSDLDYLCQRAASLAAADSDFTVALSGLRYGSSLSAGSIVPDAAQSEEIIPVILAANGLQEKLPISAATIDSFRLDETQLDRAMGRYAEHVARRRFSQLAQCAGGMLATVGSRVQVRFSEPMFRI